MAKNTPFLDLYKKDPVTDKNDTFNIDTMLNENWDKVDTKVKSIDELKADKTYVDSEIAEIPILDISGKADKTYVDNKVQTNVPTGAKFTDTITTINGKTGTIAKADIVALGIPAQDTVYTHPTGTNPHGTTKSDVGLSNVTNDKQMPIAGDTFTGISKAQNNTSHTVAQIRNVILSTSDADVSSMGEGGIWIKYT